MIPTTHGINNKTSSPKIKSEPVLIHCNLNKPLSKANKTSKRPITPADTGKFSMRCITEATPSVLAKLEQLYSHEDSVILMGESVLQFQHPFLQQIPKNNVLELNQTLC